MEQAFNLTYDDLACMWHHHMPYGGINMIGAVENILHSAPFGAARSQYNQNQLCLCEACVFDSRISTKQLKSSTLINASLGGLGVGEIKSLFKQGLCR